MGRGRNRQGRSVPATGSAAAPAAPDPEKVLILHANGTPADVIAKVLEVEVAEVQRILQEAPAQETQPSSQSGAGDEAVKRLLKDPEELCCPLSFALMEDPVVAADGITYERSWVEEQFDRKPNKSPTTGQPIATSVLHPNQHLKSKVISFKEEAVKEILSITSGLEDSQALKLLKRGEDFVRPLLPDSSARKTLASLLLLRLKLPGNDRAEVAKEAVSLLLDVQEDGQLQQALLGMATLEVSGVLAAMEEDMVTKVRRAMTGDSPHKELVNKELARRLASRLGDDRLKCLWNLLQECLADEEHDWMQAAACVLVAHMDRLSVHLGDLHPQLLSEAKSFLEDQDAAIAFAQDFFKYDLGISAEQWPPKRGALVFHELAVRLADNRSEEKLALLLKAHGVDASNAMIRKALLEQLHQRLLFGEVEGHDVEGLFLRLSLEEGGEIPPDVLPKLTLEERHLSPCCPEHLLRLVEQLSGENRLVDGARVAMLAAKAFESMGKGTESEDAMLKAFSLDHSSPEAAQGVLKVVASTRDCCRLLKGSCEMLEKEGTQLKQHCRQLETRSQQLEERCQQLEVTCKELKAKAEMPRLELGSSLVWDISSYDFTNFAMCQVQKSEEFQLVGGITAHLQLYYVGNETILCVSLLFDRPVEAECTVQFRGGEAKALAKANDCLWRVVLPSAAVDLRGSITLRVLSLRALDPVRI